MKKPLALLVAAAALSLSAPGVSLAAADTNPFADVPANHWAYDAVAALQKDGVISGYSDNTFRGDRTLTRYELAAIVAKISDSGDNKNSGLITKLQNEFSNELYNLGVRVDALEKNASTIKFSGFSRLRYAVGGTNKIQPDTKAKNSSKFYQRVHLNMNARVNENTEFIGVIRGQNNNNIDNADGKAPTTSTGSAFLQRAEFKFTKDHFNARAGRLALTLGQGLIWDNKADGLLVGYGNRKASLSAGYVDLTPSANSTDTSKNALVANLGLKLNNTISLTAGYLDVINPEDNFVQAKAAVPANNQKAVEGKPSYDFRQVSLGSTIKVNNNLSLSGEYVHNMDAPAGAQDNGVWTRLKWKSINNKKPGTYTIYADYLKIGNWAVDSAGYTLDVSGTGLGDGNGKFGDGLKGWGVGVQYVLAKNVNLGVAYYDLKPYDAKASGFDKYKKSYMVTTQFYF